MLKKIRGYKTYFIALCTIVYALLAHYQMNTMSLNSMMDMIFAALGVGVGIRSAIGSALEQIVAIIEK